MNKKAQMKIQQMAIMLLAVTLFFILVGIFVLVFRFAGLKESAVLLDEQNAQLLVTKLANSPEFSCGNSFGTGKIDCIDSDKALSLKKSADRYRLSSFWGSNIANIEIRKPSVGGNIECTVSNYPDCDFIRIFQGELSGTSVGNFVSLCRKEASENSVYDKCEVAKIFVSYSD